MGTWLVGVGVVLVSGFATWRIARRRPVYAAGPWPGLSDAGAAVLLGCAGLLAGGQLIVGAPSRALPDLPLLALAAFAPLALATRITRMPGAAAASCGAYLLPRTLISLVNPTIELPPLLLVPSISFELSLWLRLFDLTTLVHTWPGRHAPWRRRGRLRSRRIGVLRAASAGAVFGVVLAIVEPPFAIMLGADASLWTGPDVWLAGGIGAAACGATGLVARDKES